MLKNKNISRILSTCICLTITTLVMFGCSKAELNKDLLSQIDTVAVVTIDYDRNAQTSGGGLGALKSLGKMIGMDDPVGEEEQVFYNNFTADVMKVITDYSSFDVKEIGEYFKNPTYLTLSKEPKKNPYTPEGYRKIKFNDETPYTELCDALNVDAIIVINFTYAKSEQKVMMVTKTLQTLWGTMKMVNKSGEQVLKAKIKSDSVEFSSGISMLPGEFEGDKLELYADLRDSFLENFQVKLEEAQEL